MSRTKKIETVEKTEKKNIYYQVVKKLKNGSVMMIKGYDKEIKEK